MRILVWQWGRRGAGPRCAAELAQAFARVPGTDALLSLAAAAELLQLPDAPICELKMRTYASLPDYVGRMLTLPALAPGLARFLRRERIDLALCAMPAAMDLVMAAGLRLAGVPYAVVVHDADLHPGDRYPMQIALQRWLVRGAAGVVALSEHVAGRMQALGMVAGKRLIMSSLPPLHYGPMPPPPCAHGGKRRLLSFGRLLPYKGLDLLAEAVALLGPRDDLEIRVVGSGPDSDVLGALMRLPGVTVENRWVAEQEIASLIGWADGLVLSHREASQSGVAAAAMAARRWVIATRVGGLAEQLAGEPMAILCAPSAPDLAAAIADWLGRDPGATPRPLEAAWAAEAAHLVAELASLSKRR